MLSDVRKYAYSWQMKTLYILIALTFFGGFGLASYLRSCSLGKMDPYTIARINGRSITMEEFQRAYNNALNVLRDKLGDNFSEEILKKQNFKGEVLRGMIQRTLILERAKEMGLVVTDEELRSSIARMFSDEKGYFDAERYRRALRANRLQASQFEEAQREEILLSKAQELILSSASLTEDEITLEYRLRNEKVNIAFASFETKEGAEGLLRTLSNGRKLPRGLSVEETGFFTREGGNIPKIGISEDGVARAFSLTEDNPVAEEPLFTNGKYYALWLKGKQDIIPSRFKKEKEKFAGEILKEKRQRLLHNWIESLTEEARLSINEPVLESFGTGGE